MEEASKCCFKCGEVKYLSAFYKHPKMSDGYLNKCKECHKEDIKRNKEYRREYYLEYDRNRPNAYERNVSQNEKRKEKRKEDPTYKESITSINKKWVEANPNKRKAQSAATNAVRDGKLERKYSCEHCGMENSRLHKHHWSYLPEHWLDVVWLCPKCHGEEHRRLNELRRDPDKYHVLT